MNTPGTPKTPQNTPRFLVVDADTVEQFLAVLRTIHKRSRLTAGQIAKRSGIPRSTVYRFINPETTSLPKSREYVLKFVRACGCNDHEIDRVEQVWHKLNRAANEPVTEMDFAERAQRAPALTSRQPSPPEEHQQKQLEFVQKILEFGAEPANCALPPPRRWWEPRTQDHSEVVPFTTVEPTLEQPGRKRGLLLRGNHSTRPAPAPQVRAMNTTRLNLVLLLGTSLLFLSISVQDVPVRFAAPAVLLLLLVSSVVVMRNPAIVRMRSVRSRGKFIIAVAIGTGALALALYPSPKPYAATATGFLVLVAALIWIDVVQWHELRTLRGICLLTLAVSFGTVIGMVHAEFYPLTGATLTGILTAGWAFLELTFKIDDQRWL